MVNTSMQHKSQPGMIPGHPCYIWMNARTHTDVGIININVGGLSAFSLVVMISLYNVHNLAWYSGSVMLTSHHTTGIRLDGVVLHTDNAIPQCNNTTE